MFVQSSRLSHDDKFVQNVSDVILERTKLIVNGKKNVDIYLHYPIEVVLCNHIKQMRKYDELYGKQRSGHIFRFVH